MSFFGWRSLSRISTNFLPNDPVPPVISTVESDQRSFSTAPLEGIGLLSRADGVVVGVVAAVVLRVVIRVALEVHAVEHRAHESGLRLLELIERAPCGVSTCHFCA